MLVERLGGPVGIEIAVVPQDHALGPAAPAQLGDDGDARGGGVDLGVPEAVHADETAATQDGFQVLDV